MSLPEPPVGTSYFTVERPRLPVDEGDAALLPANPNLPYDEALAAIPIPQAVRRGFPEFGECDDFSDVTHFVLKVYYIEQAKILARAGVRYNWNYPFCYWHFLGRIVSEAFLGAEDQLHLINASVTATERELVSFATRLYTDGLVPMHDLRVVEVHLGWEAGRNALVDELQAFWKPARRNIMASIHWSLRQQMTPRYIEPPAELPHEVKTDESKPEKGTDDCTEAVLPLKSPEAPQNHQRIMMMQCGRLSYSVYFSPLEYRVIPLEEC